MWRPRSSRLIVLATLAGAAIALRSLGIGGVNAQDFGITAFPANIEAQVGAGESTRLLVQFKNQTNDFVSGRIRVFDYIIIDKQGTPQLLESGSQKPKYSAASWITPEMDRVTIGPDDYVAVNLRVQVPPEFPTCGAYAAVLFENAEQQFDISGKGRNSASAITARVGSLVSFRAKGKACNESVRILNVQAPSFLEYGPIRLQFDLLNAGDVHVSPKLTLSIKDWRGSVSDKKNLADRRIFPESAKAYKETIGGKWLFGPQTVLLAGTYGVKELPITYALTVWVFPWRLTLGVLLLALILWLLLKRYTGGIKEREEELQEELSEERKEIDELTKKLSKKEE